MQCLVAIGQIVDDASSFKTFGHTPSGYAMFLCHHFDAENSFFDYEEMGFGEICKSEEELVDSIIEYMENECEIKDKYSKRISAFYEFRDKNNCKRVYDKIKSIKPKD